MRYPHTYTNTRINLFFTEFISTICGVMGSKKYFFFHFLLEKPFKIIFLFQLTTKDCVLPRNRLTFL